MLGREQYALFVRERFEEQQKTITDPLKKNKLPLFSKKKNLTKVDHQVAALKEDRSLFGRLYIASQNCDGDLQNFFKHENQPWPPSLSQYGELRSGTKSDLLQCLEELSTPPRESPHVDVAVLDGAFIVQMLGTGTSTTFQEYVDTVFMPYIRRKLMAVHRVDIVWDVYKSSSLKSGTRTKRGSGLRRRVTLSTTIPGNWQSFLQVNENKTELFALLAEQIALMHIDGKEVHSTQDKRVLCSPIRADLSTMAPCSHEEADSRILLHVADATNQGHKQIMIHTSDTDVLVLAVSYVNELFLESLWLAFGRGKNFRYISVHEIAAHLGPRKSVTLRMFHAFTGCDTVSSFGGREKKTAWKAWNAFPAVTDVFYALASPPVDVTEYVMAPLQRFVIYLYDKTCNLSDINEARQYLFCQKTRDIENIPPTKAALLQHTQRARYQACYIWGQALVPSPVLPDPSDWGWKQEKGVWEPNWTLLPQVVTACAELTRCGCKKSCRIPCRCAKAGLTCSALCLCGGFCFQDWYCTRISIRIKSM